MPYATLQNLIDRFGAAMILGQTDRATPPAGVIDQAVVDRALADADAMINGYIGTRYQVPLTEVPPQIADIAQSIAIWKLHIYKPDEKIELDYKEALRALRDISAGIITLNATTLTPTPQGGTGARLTDRERPLTAENLKGFI